MKEKNNYVPLGFDQMAKKIFGDQNKTKNIKYLIKMILDMDVKEVTVLNNEIIDKPYKDKKYVVDLLVKLEDDEMVGIEMNTEVSKELINRNLFYMARVMIMSI